MNGELISASGLNLLTLMLVLPAMKARPGMDKKKE